MQRCGLHLRSRENEVVTLLLNGTSSVRQPWQREEPIDAGQLMRCSCAPCQRFPLERLRSQMGVQYHVAGRLLQVPAAELE